MEDKINMVYVVLRYSIKSQDKNKDKKNKSFIDFIIVGVFNHIEDAKDTIELLQSNERKQPKPILAYYEIVDVELNAIYYMQEGFTSLSEVLEYHIKSGNVDYVVSENGSFEYFLTEKGKGKLGDIDLNSGT